MKQTSILGGALLLTGANLLLRLISIAFNVFLAEQIGAEGLGLLQLISSVGIFAILVGSSGVRIAAMCLCAEEFGKGSLLGVRAAVSACIRFGLLVSSLTGFVLFLTAKPIAVFLLQNSSAAPSLAVMGILLPFSCLSGVMGGYYTACGKIRRLVFIQFAERILSLLFTAILLLFWAKGNLSRCCCAIILSSSLGAVFEFFFLYAHFRRATKRGSSGQKSPSMKHRLLHLCIPIALNDYLRAGLNTAEQLLIPYGLARYGGSSAAAMADYGTIHAMVFPVLMFPAAILYSVSDLLVPELSRSRAMGRSLRITDLTDKCLRLTLLFACCVSGFLFCAADALGVLIYDSTSAGIYLKIFAPMVLMLYFDAIADGMLKGMAEQVSCVRYNTFTSLLDVIFLFFLLPRWGIAAYIFSFVLTHGINLFLSVRRLLKVTSHTPKFPRLMLPLFLLIPTVLCVCFLPANSSSWNGLLQRGGLFLLLYCPLCLLLDALSPKDLRWLNGVFSHNKKVLPKP